MMGGLVLLALVSQSKYIDVGQPIRAPVVLKLFSGGMSNVSKALLEIQVLYFRAQLSSHF
jgi:hypothetical protein